MKKISLISLMFCCFLTLIGCNENNNESSSYHTHNVKETYEFDKTNHYKKCLDCNEIVEQENHKFVKNNDIYRCEICNYAKGVPQEELFKTWLKGVNYFKNYDGDITISMFNQNEYEHNGQYIISNEYSYSNDKYYVINESYIPDGNGSSKFNSSYVETLKKVMDDGKEKTKLYKEIKQGDLIRKEGSYVSPNYESTIEKFDKSVVTEYSFFDINSSDYDTFCTKLKNNVLEVYGNKIDYIDFKVNTDNSISFSFAVRYDYVEQDLLDKDYQKTIGTDTYTFIVLDEKLITSNYESEKKYVYDGEKTYRYYETQNMRFKYSFNTSKYDSISIETENTENRYYGSVLFNVEGYLLRYTDEAYVDEKYTSSMASEFLINLSDFIISGNKTVKEEYFTFYLDEDYTIPFEEELITNDENKTLYVKFEMPSDLAMVVCVFKNKTRQWIYLAYLRDINSTFKAGSIYSEYKIYSIDGKMWDDNDSTNIECVENRAYVIVFDTPHLAG